MKIKLRVKKTSTEFQEALWNFERNAVEAAFRIAGWCVLLGVLKYLSEKSGSLFLECVQWGLYLLLGLYITGFFHERFEIALFDEANPKPWHWWIEAVTAALGAFALTLFFNMVITQLVFTLAGLQGK